MKNQKQLKALAHEVAVSFCNSEKGLTSIMRTCKSEDEVIFTVQALKDDLTPTLKEMESLHMLASIERKIDNGISQFIARCRNGSDKLPPVWFNKERTLSFDPLSFVAVKTRQTKKKGNDDAKTQEISRLADERVKSILDDKVQLTKLQDKKVSKALQDADKKVSKALQDSDKVSKALESEKALSADNARKVEELKRELQKLADLHSKAKRQIEALKKALQLAQVDRDAIELILKQA